MKKKAFILPVSLAVALCAMGFAAPAAAEDGPSASPTPRPSVAPSFPRTFGPLDALIEYATSLVTPHKAASDGLPAPTAPPPTSAPLIPTAIPSRVAPLARSYPRTFSTYDALVEYASSIATAQQASDDRLAVLLVGEDAARATLASVFEPHGRGDFLDAGARVLNATIQKLRTQLAEDGMTARQLRADGAFVAPPAPWSLPLLGEDTQDFGPTPYYFEPALIYGGVYYRHFHAGTDIAAAWGTPILAPATGMVVFAGRMGDGAEVVVIAHDAGLVSMYAHLDNHVFPVPVKAGDTVQAGDRIGNVGLTGITTGAHLHWSVWRNSELIDPLSMIKG